MKLHLPKGLRKALVACLAAVAVPAALLTTLGTASGIVAAMYAASQTAQAVENPPAEAPDILPIAVTTGSTTDKDATHRQLIGEEVIYSGTIYTWDVAGEGTQHSFLSSTQFSPWVQNGEGMQDSTATTGKTIWDKFTHGSNNSSITYDTLRLKGASDAVTLDIHNTSSQPNSGFRLGGLIVEEGGSYTINVEYDASNPMALYWGAGTGTNKFDALVLSDITFANVRNAVRQSKAGENTYGFHILADADVRIAVGKTLAVDSVLQIDGGKSVNLIAVGAAEGAATFRVGSIDTSSARGDESPTLEIGDGVTMDVTGGITAAASDENSLNIILSGTLTIGGNTSGSIDLTFHSGAVLNLNGGERASYQFNGFNDVQGSTGITITIANGATLSLIGDETYSTCGSIDNYNVTLKKSGSGTQTFSSGNASHVGALYLTEGGLVFGGDLGVSGSGAFDFNQAWTQVSGGTSLVVKGNFSTANSVSVSGENSSMTVGGNATLSSWGKLTVDGGATVTIYGTLDGNKGGAGELRIGSYDTAKSTGTKGTLILGAEGAETTPEHKTDAIKVYGEGSSLTVYGNLTAESYEATGNGTGTFPDAALEIKYGASASIFGNLTLGTAGSVYDDLQIGGTEAGNSGGLSVSGNLIASGITLQGANSSLTVGGDVTCTDITTNGENVTVTVDGALTLSGTNSTLGARTALNVTGLSRHRGLGGLSGNGTLNIALTADDTPTAPTTFGVNTSVSTKGSVKLILNEGAGITVAAGKTLTFGSGVTVMVNAGNLFTLEGSGDGQAKIVLEEGAVINVGAVVGNLKSGNTWLNISGDGEVYHEVTGDISASGIKFDADYHVKSASGTTNFVAGVGSITVRDLILDGNFKFNNNSVNIHGLVGTNAEHTVTANGTWTLDVGTGEDGTPLSKEFLGTFTGSATITKTGVGTQVLGKLGNFVNLTVTGGTMKLNDLEIASEQSSTVTLAPGAVLDLSTPTAVSIGEGGSLAITVITGTPAENGAFPAGHLWLNTQLITGLTEYAQQGQLTLTLTGLTENYFKDKPEGSDGKEWVCDLFAGMTVDAGTATALTDFLVEALDLSVLESYESKVKVSVDERGYVTVELKVDDLTVGGNITWRDGGTGWTGGDSTFNNEDNVTFTATDPITPATVTMEGNIIAGDFTINRGKWIFKNSGTDEHPLTVQGDITVNEGTEVQWDTGVTGLTLIGDHITINGTWGTTLQEDGTANPPSLVITLADSAMSPVEGKQITINGTMTVKSILPAAGSTEAAQVTVADGGTLNVTDNLIVTTLTVGNTVATPDILLTAGENGDANVIAGTLTLSGNGTAPGANGEPAEYRDVLIVNPGGDASFDNIISTGNYARITVNGGTLTVGTEPGGTELLIQMNSGGRLNIENGGTLTVYGKVATGSDGTIDSVTVSGTGSYADITDILRAGEVYANDAGKLTVRNGLTGTSSVNADAGTLTVGTDAERTRLLQMTPDGTISVTNGGTLTVYGKVAAETDGLIASVTVSNAGSRADITGSLYAREVNVTDLGELTVGTPAENENEVNPTIVLRMGTEGTITVESGGEVYIHGSVAADANKTNIKAVTLKGEGTYAERSHLDVYGDLYTNNAEVHGGILDVKGLLCLSAGTPVGEDDGGGVFTVLTIDGGGVVSAGSIGASDSPAGRIEVGGTTAGTLTVGTELAFNSPGTQVDVLKAYGLQVQALGSAVTVWGDAAISGTFTTGPLFSGGDTRKGNFALIIESGEVDIRGNLRGNNETTVCNDVAISGAGSLHVGKDMRTNNLYVNGGRLEVDDELLVDGSQSNTYTAEVWNNGTMHVGNAAELNKLIVRNGTVTVEGQLYVSDHHGGDTALFVTDGGTVTAGYMHSDIINGSYEHVGCLVIGDEHSNGSSLTITGEGNPEDCSDVLMAKSLKVQNAAVSVTGNANFYNFVYEDGKATKHGLKILGDSSVVTITGNLRGDKAKDMHGIYIAGGGTLNVGYKPDPETPDAVPPSSNYVFAESLEVLSGSKVNVAGSVFLTGYIYETPEAPPTPYGLNISDGSTVTVTGGLHSGTVGTSRTGGVHVTGGSHLTVGTLPSNEEGEEVEGDPQNMSATRLDVADTGSEVIVTGRLDVWNGAIPDAVLTVVNGGSVTAGCMLHSEGGDKYGFVGHLEVGSEDSAGTLTLTGEGRPVVSGEQFGPNETLKAESLLVRNVEFSDDVTERSVVTVEGSVALGGLPFEDGHDTDYGLDIIGYSYVDIHGDLRCQNPDTDNTGSGVPGIHVAGGGELRVTGEVRIENALGGEGLVIEDGTVGIHGGFTAGNLQFAKGNLTLDGKPDDESGISRNVNVSIGTALFGDGVSEEPTTAYAVVSDVTITGTGKWKVQKGATLEIKEPEGDSGRPALTVENDSTNLTIEVVTGGDKAGGLLKMTDAVMESLRALHAEHPERLSLDLGVKRTDENDEPVPFWEYHLFDVNGLGDTWTKEKARKFLMELLPDDDGTVDVDGDGIIYWEDGQWLTWIGTDDGNGKVWGNDNPAVDPKNWAVELELGKEAAANTTFDTHDRVTFDANGEAHSEIIIHGTVDPRDIYVKTGTYTFTGEYKDGGSDDAKLAAVGKLTVEGGASATFKHLTGFSVNNQQDRAGDGVDVLIKGALVLDEVGPISLGTASVEETGSLTVTKGVARDWTDTTVYGAGKVVLNSNDPVTVNESNNLFDALFADDLNSDRDNVPSGNTTGIGTFELSTGMWLTLSFTDREALKSLGYIHKLVVSHGATLTIDAGRQFDNRDNGQETYHSGTLVLAGDGVQETDTMAALIVNAVDYMKWDVELAEDASVLLNNNTTLHFGGNGDFSGSLNGHAYKLTVKGAGTLKIDEGFRMINEEGGTIDMLNGTKLWLQTGSALDMSEYNVVLSDGTMDVSQSASLKTLSGSGLVTFKTDNNLTLVGVAEPDSQIFTGSITNEGNHNGTVTVNTGAIFRLGNNAHICTALGVTGTLSVDNGTATYDGITGENCGLTGNGTIAGAGELLVTSRADGTFDGTLAITKFTFAPGVQKDNGSNYTFTLSGNIAAPTVPGTGTTLGINNSTIRLETSDSVTLAGLSVTGNTGVLTSAQDLIVNTANAVDNGALASLTASRSLTLNGGILTVGTATEPTADNIFTVRGTLTVDTATLTVNGIARAAGEVAVKNNANLSITGNLVGSSENDPAGALKIGTEAGTDTGTKVTVGGLTNVSALTMTAGKADLRGELLVGGEAAISGGVLTVDKSADISSLAVSGGTSYFNNGLTVASGATVSGGTLAAAGTVTASHGMTWSITGSGVFEMGKDARLTVGGDNNNTTDFTLRVETGTTIDDGGRIANGGKLHLSKEAVDTLIANGVLEFTLAGGVPFPEDTWTYQLFDMGQITGTTQASKEELTDLARALLGDEFGARALSVNDQGILTFNGSAADVNPQGLTWQDGVSVWRNGGNMMWMSLIGNTPFFAGDSVSFDTEAEHTVTVFGRVRPENMTVTKGNWVFNTHPDSQEAKIQGTGTLTIGAGASVTFNNGAGAGNLSVSIAGGVTLNGEGAKLVLGPRGSWNFGEKGITLTEGSVVEVKSTALGGVGLLHGYGTGELVLNTGTAFDESTVANILGTDASEPDSTTIYEMTVRGGTGLVIGGHNAGDVIMRDIRGEITVENGGALAFGCPSMTQNPELTVHIAGEGRPLKEGETGPENHNPTTSSYAALGLYNYSGWGAGNSNHADCSFNIALDEDATVGVGNENVSTIAVTMLGDINFNGHTLRKIGEGKWILNGTVSPGSGILNIAQGTVQLGTEQDTEFNILTGIDVQFSGGSLTVNQKAEVHSLFGTGSITYRKDDCELTIVGDSPEKADGSGHEEFTGNIAPGGVSSVRVAGTGTLRLGGGARIGNVVYVDDGGTSEINGVVTKLNPGKKWDIRRGGHVILNNESTLKAEGDGIFNVDTEGTVTLGEGVELSHGITFNIGRTGVFEMVTGGGLTVTERTGQVILNVTATDEGNGGKLRLNEAAMDNLKDLGEAGDMLLEFEDLDPWTEWSYHLFDTNALADDWDTGKAEAMLGALLDDAYTSGRHKITVDVDGIVHYTTLTRLLTWTGGASTTWESDGTEKDWKDTDEAVSFADGDSVVFDSAAANPGTVEVVGSVQPEDMAVKAGVWEFTGDNDDARIWATGNLYIEAGASASFTGTLNLQTLGAFVDGELHLSTTGNKILGEVEIREGGAVYLEFEGAGTWVPETTVMSGDGRVVLGTGAEINEGNNLFANLFAGGDPEVQRAYEHAGIGTFEIAEGSAVRLSGNIGKSLSLVRNLQVDDGASLLLSGNLFDNEVAGYERVGSLTLAGDGVFNGKGDEGAGALVTDGNMSVKWNVELTGDAKIYNKNGQFRFTGSSQLDAHGNKLTLAGADTGKEYIFGGSDEDGFCAVDGSTGTIALAEGVSLTVHTGQSRGFVGYDLRLAATGTSLTVRSDTAFNNITGTGRVTTEAGKSLALDGNINLTGETGVVTLNTDSKLLIYGTGTNSISSLVLNGPATVESALGSDIDYTPGVLRIDNLVNEGGEGGNTLDIILVGVMDYIEAHTKNGVIDPLQLFTGEAVGALYNLRNADKLHIDGIIGYDWQLNNEGQILFTEIPGEYTWTDSKHNNSHRLTWLNGVVGNEYGKWDGGASYRNGPKVNLVGDTGEAVTVTVSGTVESKEVNITGNSTFTFDATDGGKLHVVDMNAGTDSTFNPEVTLERLLTVKAGKKVSFNAGLTAASGSKVVLEKDAMVQLVGDNALLAWNTDITGEGIWEVDLSGGNGWTYDGAGVTSEKGVTMRVKGAAEDVGDDEAAEGDAWSYLANLRVLGDLQLVSGSQFVFDGNNSVGSLSAVYTNDVGNANPERVIIQQDGATFEITGENDTDLAHVCLDIRSGSFTQKAGTLIIGGLRSNKASAGHVDVNNLTIQAYDTWNIIDAGNTGAQREYEGTVQVSGNLTMQGKPGDEFTQYIIGEVEVGGTVDVQSGTLDIESEGMKVGGDLNASGGHFRWHGTEISVGTLRTDGEGIVDLESGAVTVHSGISGDEGTVNIGCAVKGGDDGTEPQVVNADVVVKGESAAYGGTVVLGKGGTLTSEVNEQTFRQLTAGGGTLNVEARTHLTLDILQDAPEGTTDTPQPSGLTLNLGAGTHLTIRGGNFTLVGQFTWGHGASITLDLAEGATSPNIFLGEGFNFPQVAPNEVPDDQLTFNLSAAYLDAVSEGVQPDENTHKYKVDFLNNRSGSSGWQAGWEEYFRVLASENPWRYAGLTLTSDGYLTWDEKEGIVWNGGADGNWNDRPSGDWEDIRDPEEPGSPSGNNVYLTEEGAGPEGKATLTVEGTVHPSNVFVESGEYTLEGTGGGLRLDRADGQGMLVIEEGAQLNLNLRNTSLPVVVTEGKLGIGNDAALPVGTDLQLNKEGTLLYTEPGTAQDVSTMVSEKSTSSVLHIEVGENAGTNGSVTWGLETSNPVDNRGLKLALDGGTVKSGKGNFTLHWTDNETHVGRMEVNEGRLTLQAAGDSTLNGASTTVKDAALVLGSTGSSVLTYGGTVSGDGTLEINSGKVSLTGANTVSKIDLTDGTVILNNDEALGNAGTTLTLKGGDIQAGKSNNKVNAGTVVVEGVSSIVGGDVEITGKLTQDGTLKLENSATGTLSGNIAEFTGILDTGTGSWTLKGTSGEVKAGAAGVGTLVADSESEITLTGQLGATSDSVTLQNAGSGNLVIATDTVGAGTKLSAVNGDIVLGSTSAHLTSWNNGSASGSGAIVLANVTLANAHVFDNLPDETKLIVRTAPTTAAQSDASVAKTPVVDVTGTDAGNIDGITVNAHGLLQGLTGTLTKDKSLELHFSAENRTTYSGSSPNKNNLTHLIEGRNDLFIERSDDIQLAFDSDILSELVDDNTSFYILTLKNATWSTDGDLYEDMKNSNDQIADVLALAMNPTGVNKYTEDGLILSVQPQYLYLVMPGGDPNSSDSPLDLYTKKATVVTDGQKLTLNWSATDPNADKAIVRNLLGMDGSQLVIRNTTDNPTVDRLSVTFDNTFYEDVADDRYDRSDLPESGWIAVRGQDTTFKGSVTGDVGVDIVKTGMGTLTVGGNYKLTDGTTYLAEGALVLQGQDNRMKSVEFTYTGEPGKDEGSNDTEERGLVLVGGHTTLESVVDAGSADNGANVILRNGAVLSLTGASSLSRTTFSTGEGAGTIILESSETSALQTGSLVLSGNASVHGAAVRLQGENTLLDVGVGVHDVSSLDGNGILRGASGGSLTVGGGTFSGLLGSANAPSDKGGKLIIGKDASFTFKNTRSETPDKAHGWEIEINGKLTLELAEMSPESPLIFGQVTLNGDLVMNLDADKGGAPVKGDLTLSDSSTFTVYATGKHGDSFSLGFSSTDDMLDVLKRKLKLTGPAFILDDVDNVELVGDDKTITVTTHTAAQNKFDKAMPGAHRNSRAGATLLWDSLNDPSGAFLELLNNPNSDYAKMVLSLYNLVESGDSAGLERPLAAVAGSSISTLGVAVSQDLHRQLSAIRNRTTTMAAEISDSFPFWHAWINGETDYRKLESDSYAPGYTLNSWGGTLGADADITSHTTIGLAVSAMYGDLKTDAADSANGDIDSVYLSAFLRTSQGPWIHTLVLSAGMSDISLDRTVNYGAGSYRTNGSTDGFSIGALYEIGYSHVLNERGTLAIQPVANIEVRHVSISGYNESGSNAGLRTDDIDRTSVTVGAGARLQAAVTPRAFNRPAIFESRLLLKAEAGDRSGTATTGFLGSKTSAEVESAEVGAFGVEVGAAISVPLGTDAGSIFLDGSFEFRDQQNSANATLGYRITF